jgi:phosphoribosylformylglycinamidine cyclo-ligase
MSKKTKAYAAAGVDVDLGNRVKSSLPTMLRSTHTPGVISLPGGFGGLFSARFAGVHDPVLVSSMDGVGTKLKLAFVTGAHASVAADLVYHCVNDILTLGARPLFFLDYMACAKLEPAVFRQVISGLARACRATGCALIGGETAQMSDMYRPGEYDLAGTIVGVVSRGQILTGSAIREGDALIGVPSTGLHTNGYTLARKILLEQEKFSLSDPLPGAKNLTVGAALLRPHRCYLKEYGLLKKSRIAIRGMAHITGGGLPDNLPRVLPGGLDARIYTASWPVPPLMRLLVERGRLERAEAYQTFNMGIGYVFVVPQKQAQQAARLVRGRVIGEVVAGSKKVLLE